MLHENMVMAAYGLDNDADLFHGCTQGALGGPETKEAAN
jgi:hypothetical protein